MRWNFILIAALVAGCISPNMNGEGGEEEERPCDCDVAAFSTGQWGRVRVRVEGNDLLITLPIQGSVKCVRDRGAAPCMATLKAAIPTNGVQLSKAPDSSVVEPNEFMPTSSCALNSATKFDHTAVFKATYAGGVPGDLAGTVKLSVSLSGCRTNASRTVAIKIDGRGLDSGGSDFDGDGELNRTDREDWDPAVK